MQVVVSFSVRRLFDDMNFVIAIFVLESKNKLGSDFSNICVFKIFVHNCECQALVTPAWLMVYDDLHVPEGKEVSPWIFVFMFQFGLCRIAPVRRLVWEVTWRKEKGPNHYWFRPWRKLSRELK